MIKLLALAAVVVVVAMAFGSRGPDLESAGHTLGSGIASIFPKGVTGGDEPDSQDADPEDKSEADGGSEP